MTLDFLNLIEDFHLDLAFCVYLYIFIYFYFFQWEVPSVYSGVILGIKDNLTRDLVYILMAKGLHCSTVMVSKGIH